MAEVLGACETPPEIDGQTVRPVKPYGVGIDCHSRFIQVCVLVQREALRRSYGLGSTRCSPPARHGSIDGVSGGFSFIRVHSRPSKSPGRQSIIELFSSVPSIAGITRA